jgi:hypothetical protein
MNGYPKVFNIESDTQEERQYRRDVQLGFRAVVEGGGGLQGDSYQVSEPTGGEHDTILMRSCDAQMVFRESAGG